MRILLLALTGFGNGVLDVLLQESCEVVALLTRKEVGPYPYYPEKNIAQYATEKGVKVYEEFNWNLVKEIIRKESPELLLVATFHKIIPNEILSMVSLGINFHPSLLPKYRGPAPISWVLFNKEKKTGITAHLLSEKVDAGDILMQKEILIEETDTEETLRKKLAILTAELTQELVSKLKNNSSLKPFPQNEKEATYFPKFKKIE